MSYHRLQRLRKIGENRIFMKLAILHSTIRAEEKLLMEASKERKIDIVLIDIRDQIFNPATYKVDFDIALERSVSSVKGMYATQFLESLGVPVVNTSRIAAICQDKFLTSLSLKRAGVPTPKFALVFSERQAIEAVEELGGYPVVVKPNLGSWGRLVAKVNDQDALEAIIEQKTTLGGPHHQAIYVQEYIEKPGRDIRIHVIGGKVIAAIYRQSEHWITNTARGAEAIACKIDNELSVIAEKAAGSIGVGVLGLDILETKTGYVANEVNHTMEFKNVQRVTKIDIAGTILNYCMSVVKK